MNLKKELNETFESTRSQTVSKVLTRYHKKMYSNSSRICTFKFIHRDISPRRMRGPAEGGMVSVYDEIRLAMGGGGCPGPRIVA